MYKIQGSVRERTLGSARQWESGGNRDSHIPGSTLSPSSVLIYLLFPLSTESEAKFEISIHLSSQNSRLQFLLLNCDTGSSTSPGSTPSRTSTRTARRRAASRCTTCSAPSSGRRCSRRSTAARCATSAPGPSTTSRISTGCWSSQGYSI